MKKLLLDVDTLEVESFPTAETLDPRGTVAAHEAEGVFATRLASCFTSCRADLRDACTCPIP